MDNITENVLTHQMRINIEHSRYRVSIIMTKQSHKIKNRKPSKKAKVPMKKEISEIKKSWVG